MNRYLIIIVEGMEGYGAYAPDLPNCFAVAKELKEVITLIKKSIELYLDSLEQKGELMPIPSKVKDSIHKTENELEKIFSTINPDWKSKFHPYKVSYVIPAEEENIEIQKLIKDVKEEKFDYKKVKKISPLRNRTRRISILGNFFLP